MTFANKKSSPVQFNPREHEMWPMGEDVRNHTFGLGVARLKGKQDHAVWVTFNPVEPTELRNQIDPEQVAKDLLPHIDLDLPVLGPIDDWSKTKSEGYRAKRRHLRKVSRSIHEARWRGKIRVTSPQRNDSLRVMLLAQANPKQRGPKEVYA